MTPPPSRPPLFQAGFDAAALKLRDRTVAAMRTLERVPPEKIMQLLEIARLITGAPTAFVNLVDVSLVTELIASGTSGGRQHAADDTFCSHVVKAPEQVLVVPDATRDPRFAQLPVVTGDAHIRFYAGTAILSPDGIPIGTLCVMDKVAREELSEATTKGLVTLAAAVTARLELRQQIDELEEERSKFIAFMDHGPVVSFMKDDEGRYAYVNQRFKDSFGMTDEQLIGKRDRDLWPADIASALEAHDRWILLQEAPVELTEAGPADADGNVTWWQSYKFVVPGKRRLLGGMSLNVSELHRMQSTFRQLASTDALTGLPNRHALNEVLTDMVDQRSQSGELTAVLFMDLDHFKLVNDTLGHQAGDMLLVEFADRLRRAVRSSDKVFRLAGDEFVVVLDGLHDTNEATRVADKIIEAMKPTMNLNGQPHQASTSIGIAIRPSGEVDSAGLLAMADEALYQAKRSGRGGYALAS